jgi:DNA segregation ATPase FtsK/SpoIIIE, S-DNA-T family
MRRTGRYPYPDAYPWFPMPAEPWGWLAAAGIARWCYRYRSELRPFLVAAVVFTVAAILHGGHGRAHWLVFVIVATAPGAAAAGIPHAVLRRRRAGRRLAGLLARGWAVLGADRAIERYYAAGLITVAGSWLAAAICLGPATEPLPKAWLAGTVALGIPWWCHRRRREKVRVERKIYQWPRVAEDIGLPGAEITSAVVDPQGWTARITLKHSATPDQAAGKIPAIESGLQLRRGSVRISPDPAKAHVAVMRVTEHDPHQMPTPWPGPSITSIAQPASLGVGEDGRPVRVVILRRNVLIGGMTGSGKSGLVNDLIADLVACTDVVLWGIDLKGGMELGPWERCFARLATTPAQACDLLADAVAWLDERAARMAAARRRVLEPSPHDPALVIIVDEWAELPAAAHDPADSIARRGRAVAVNLIAATQRPTQEAMGGQAVRSQMDVRACLRVRENRDTDLILGQGAATAGWQATQLAQPGTFLLSSPGHQDPAARHRAYLITDAQIARHAARHAAGRPVLGGNAPQTAASPPKDTGQAPAPGSGKADPDTLLWEALSRAPARGIPVAGLVTATGMGRTWVYERLRKLATDGRATQTRRGCWRAASPPPGPAAAP